MQFIRVIDFEKFQHYRDRKPPWIKLYRDLLSDDRLFELSEADRYQLVALFLLASQHDNRIPFKDGWLRKELGINRPISLQKLVDAGWITLLEQDASGMLHASDVLANPEQAAIPRARAESREEKSREEKSIYMPYGEFGNCKLSAEEHGKLVAKLNGNLDSYIQRFDRWIEEAKNPNTGQIPLKLRNRKAYLSILNWFERDGGPSLPGTGAVHSTPRLPAKPTEEEIATETERYKKMGVIR